MKAAVVTKGQARLSPSRLGGHQHAYVCTAGKHRVSIQEQPFPPGAAA
jgi:hypothetical protein